MIKSRKKEARDKCTYIYMYTRIYKYTSVEEVESVSQLSGKEGHYLVTGRWEVFEL